MNRQDNDLQKRGEHSVIELEAKVKMDWLFYKKKICTPLVKDFFKK